MSERGEVRRCAYCGCREEHVYDIQRYGGGNWRRAGRWYASSISAECARSIMESLQNPRTDSGQSISRYPAVRLREISTRGRPLDG